MDKLQLTGQNLGRVFKFRSGRAHVAHLLCYAVKQLNLKMKTRPKQLLGSFPLDIALPCLQNTLNSRYNPKHQTRMKNSVGDLARNEVDGSVFRLTGDELDRIV